MTLAILLVAILNVLLGVFAAWQRSAASRRELARLDTMLADERGRIDHLLSLLAKRDAPAEEAWYMSDQEPNTPLIPPNAVWSDDGLAYWIPSDDE